jgi:hypothetical protein
VQFQQLIKKLHRDPISIYEVDGVNAALPKAGAPSQPFCKGRGGNLRFKVSRLRQPTCQVTAIPKIDFNISSVPQLPPRESNLSNPPLFPLFLSPISLDMHGNSGSWAPSPNIRIERPARDRNTSKPKFKNFGTQLDGYFGMLNSEPKVVPPLYFRCTLPIQ